YLRFELPDARGSFRGKLQKDEGIVGVWTPQRSLANGGYSTPVTLAPPVARGRYETPSPGYIEPSVVEVSQNPCGETKPFVSGPNCLAMCRSSGSDQYGPMSCTPMGSPSFDVPSGMTSAGWPLALNGST